jgi:hypothetical protein
MAVTGRNTLKGWFKKFLKPKEEQFAAWIDSFWHKTEDVIPIDNIENLGRILGDKIDRREIENITNQLLLERRLTLKMETAAIDLYIDEPMTIYKVAGHNIASLKINDTDVIIDATLSVGIPAKSIVRFEATRTLTDPTAYLYVYAKVKTI